MGGTELVHGRFVDAFLIFGSKNFESGGTAAGDTDLLVAYLTRPLRTSSGCGNLSPLCFASRKALFTSEIRNPESASPAPSPVPCPEAAGLRKGSPAAVTVRPEDTGCRAISKIISVSRAIQIQLTAPVTRLRHELPSQATTRLMPVSM
jgi:hypothetical protein